MTCYHTKRNSGIELLRIISMFLVLMIHANRWDVKLPELDAANHPLSAGITIGVQTLSCVCVNVFVLISGWFGIRFSFRGMFRFLFQCLFFLCSIYSIMVIIGLCELNIEGIAGCFCLLKWNWFIKTYLLLYILSPILNRFLETTNRKELERILILFYGFQSIYGWLTDAAFFFEWGLSVTSFVGLYLLAQYIRKYIYPQLHVFKLSGPMGGGKIILLYITFSIALFIITFICAYYQINYITGKIFAYTSPLVIIISVFLLLIFVKLDEFHFNNIYVNKIAASCFAAFLLHTNPNIITNYYGKICLDIYYKYPWRNAILLTTVFMVAVFAVAVIADQLRIWCWNRIDRKYFIESK